MVTPPAALEGTMWESMPYHVTLGWLPNEKWPSFAVRQTSGCSLCAEHCLVYVKDLAAPFLIPFEFDLRLVKWSKDNL